jgi:hypothetical protein
MATAQEAPHNGLPERDLMDISEGSGSSQSSINGLVCPTPSLPGFSLAAATRFAAAGLYRVKFHPDPEF